MARLRADWRPMREELRTCGKSKKASVVLRVEPYECAAGFNLEAIRCGIDRYRREHDRMPDAIIMPQPATFYGVPVIFE